MNKQNNDYYYFNDARNLWEDICTVEQCDKCNEVRWRCAVTWRTVAELHEAMMRSKENYWDEENSTDPNEFGLDAYNL